MRFFGRETELKELRKVRELSLEKSRFTVLTGRRRVGKTELSREAFDDGKTPYLNLPITRQPEVTLCAQLQEEAEHVLHLGIHGTCTRFGELFRELMKESEKRPYTLVLDEFQEFDRTNPGVYGDIQHIWDEYHNKTKLNLVVNGSVNRLMNKIFFDDAQPLYGRNTGTLSLKPFSPALLKEIFSFYAPNYSKRDLLALWTVSGGIARYVDMMMSAHAFTKEAMLEEIFSPLSAYIPEGRTILADGFGPGYGTYFTLLAAISSGQTTSAEMKNLIGAEVGGYLAKLEDQYAIIEKKQPIFEGTATKNSHFQIDDCFFRFWFRFVHKLEYLNELGRRDRMLDVALRDFDTFSGYALERYFSEKLVEEKRCTRIGGWWDRKGENEIDIVCEDEVCESLGFYEVKADASRYDARRLSEKVAAFFAKNPSKRNLVHTEGVLSLEDM
ncbi:MAG: ATP-binding protein [Kiritimatiellae bacterium]|nr:ATP-binding protein [Kiritimatiellia bacterium]